MGRPVLRFAISWWMCGGAAMGACSSSPRNDVAAIAHDEDAGSSPTDEPDGSGPLLASDSEQTDDAPAKVQLVGRFDVRDPLGPKCAWPGCRIIARFAGDTVSVELDELTESWMIGAPSEWDVAIDDVWQRKLVTASGRHSYPLASGLRLGVHKVELYKRSEAQNGVTQFIAYDFGTGKLLSPPPLRARRIEIIGDSQSAAFGVERVADPDGNCPGIASSAAWENFHKSYGALLGEVLSADVHGTAFSGKGLVKNAWRLDHEPMPVLFPRTNPIDETSAWDFSKWTPDVVVVMLGGNDFRMGEPDESGGRGPTEPAEFTEAYRAFVRTIRAKYPAAFLFLTVSPGVSDYDPPGRHARTHVVDATRTVASERAAAGDAKVYAAAPSVAGPSELTGCAGHGSAAMHVRVAGELSAVIKAKTGW